MATVCEDDVAEDEQAPAIAEHLDGGVDRAPRPRLIHFAQTACLVRTTIRYYGPGRRLQTTSGRSHVLRQVAEGVLIHESEFMQSNAVVVQGRAGVLLIDPVVTGSEIACLANDLSELG